MNIKDFLKRNLYLLGALFVFLLFYKISIRTPLAGDDWGYALNGIEENPFYMAIEFYKSWSGRFFSELYGFLVAPNKEVWNVLNPLLFVGIFVCLYFLSNNKKNYLLTILLIIFSIIGVENNVRMETYSWIMGTTYIIPLFLSLLYFLIIDKSINKNEISRLNSVILYLMNILLFVIGLMMENIGATMIVGIIILCIYSYKNNNKVFKYLIINLIVSAISFGIMRLSPGSSYRLMRDNYEWANLSLFRKIAYGYLSFIDMTFIRHKYMIFLLSLSIALVILKSKRISIVQKLALATIQAIAVVTVFSGIIVKDSFLLNPESLYSRLFWPLYTCLTILGLWVFIENKELKNKTLFFFVIAGTSSLVMLMSPLYGFRSSIYTIYFMIVVYILIFNEYLNNKYIKIITCLGMIFVIYNKYKYYDYIYTMVEAQTEQRNIKLDYYRGHPEDPEVWLERYPLYTIHGADIDPGDTYHFEVFKEYYKLPQAADKIFFYVVE